MKTTIAALVYYADPQFSPHVRRMSETLHRHNLTVWGIGIRRAEQKPYPDRILDRCDTAVQPPFARRGPLSFLHFMLYAFFVLWKTRPTLLQPIDPPALVPCWIHSVIRRIPLYYFSLEDFPACTSLVNRPVVRFLWTVAEGFCIRRAKNVALVAQVDADSYVRRYPIAAPFVVRNIPQLGPLLDKHQLTLRATFGWTTEHFVLMYHGMIEYGRGIERLFPALKRFPQLRYAVAGYGDLAPQLQQQARTLGVDTQIGWVGAFTPERLPSLLQDADLGIALIQHVSDGFYQALPCKLFECVHAAVPVLASAFPEMQRYIDNAGVGICIDPLSDTELEQTLATLIDRGERYTTLRQACLRERLQTNWESESRAYCAFLELPPIVANSSETGL